MLTDRGAAVLDAIVERYILTGEPVGSTSINQQLPQRVSSATVRNVMAELERLGYLEQPHTSAGRRPTRRGYRRYVASLTAQGRYDSVDPRPLTRALQDEPAEVQEILRRTCRLLAELSELVGVVSVPPLADTVFQHVDFVRLEGGHVLAIVVGRGGQVKHCAVALPEPRSQGQLDRSAAYLERRFAGRTLREVAHRVAELLAGASERLEDYEQQAIELGARSFRVEMEAADVLVEGSHSLVTRPDFGGREELQAVLETIEHPLDLIPALSPDAPGTTPRVVIGSEPLPAALGRCALVTATYGSGDHVLGSVAVLGPARLHYGRAIALVEAVATATSALVIDLGI